MDWILSISLGLAVGIIAPLLGIGGGILMVPMLPYLLGLSHVEAMGTSLCTITMVTSWDTILFQKKGLIVWPNVWTIALFSALFAFIAARLTFYLSDWVLYLIFAATVGTLATNVFLFDPGKVEVKKTQNSLLKRMGIGGLSGAIGGFTGIGGGSIVTPFLIVLGLTKDKQTSPTSNAVMIFTSAFGALSFALVGTIDLPAFKVGKVWLGVSLMIFIGAFVSSFLGVHLNSVIPPRLRRICLGCLLIAICCKMLYKAFIV